MKLIDADELLKKMTAIKHNHKHAIEKASIYECMDAVRHMRESKLWIPVTERLPEAEMDVIVTFETEAYSEDGSTDTFAGEGIYFVTIGWRIYDIDPVVREDAYRVTAWMPMPEPYKENIDV